MQWNTKLLTFYPKIANTFTGMKSYDKSDWSSKTRTQSGNKNKVIFAHLAIALLMSSRPTT